MINDQVLFLEAMSKHCTTTEHPLGHLTKKKIYIVVVRSHGFVNCAHRFSMYL